MRQLLSGVNGKAEDRAGPPVGPPGKPSAGPPIFFEFPPKGSEVTTPEEHDEFVNQILLNAPESWGDDVAAEAIALAYVRKLEERLRYLGSTLERYDVAEQTEQARPYFVIKCTDEFAQPIVREYMIRVGSAGRGEMGRAQAEQVRLALAELRAWQTENRIEVHFPNHDHVPAVG